MLKQILWLILGSVLVGAFLGYWYRTPWFDYKSPDGKFRCEFRREPIQMTFPKPDNYEFTADGSLKIYSAKGDFGVDEINRFDHLASPHAAADWFHLTVDGTGGELLAGNEDDFTLYLPKEQLYLRGRIIYDPTGSGIYKIFSVRPSKQELTALDTERFLFGVQFKTRK